MRYSEKMFFGVIDHTYLKTEKEGVSLPDQKKAVKLLCEEAHRFQAFSVCVREHMVSYAKECLEALSSYVKIVSVVGFPLGDDFQLEEKVALLKKAKEDGAHEFDMVIPYNALKSGDKERVFQEIKEMSLAAGSSVLKVIFENCYLTKEEKETAYEIAMAAFRETTSEGEKNRFLKTSTGFAKCEGPIGATLEDIELMYQYSKGQVGLKPAGGVKDYAAAIEFFEAAGSPWLKEGLIIDPYLFRIGTSSLLQVLAGEGKQKGQGY